MYYVIVGIPLLYTWSLAINFAHRSGSPYWASWTLLSFLAHLSVVVFLTPIRGESWWWMNLVDAHRVILGSLLWHSVLALMAVAALTSNPYSFWFCTSVSLMGYSFYWNGQVIENEKQNRYSATHPATDHAPTAMPKMIERSKKPAGCNSNDSPTCSLGIRRRGPISWASSIVQLLVKHRCNGRYHCTHIGTHVGQALLKLRGGCQVGVGGPLLACFYPPLLNNLDSGTPMCSREQQYGPRVHALGWLGVQLHPCACLHCVSRGASIQRGIAA